MSEPDHTDIGRLLANAVPPLPEPADPVGAIKARARRTRVRTGAAATGLALAVAVALGTAPALLDDSTDGSGRAGGTAEVGPDSCPDPTVREPGSGAADQAGPLVPEGAAQAMLCVVRIADGEILSAKVLTVGVDQLVATLNGFPLGGPTLSCAMPRVFEEYSLVLGYPDGPTTTVEVITTCGASQVPGRQVRLGNPLPEFVRLYQEQALADAPDPDTLTAPECAPTIPSDRVDLESASFGAEPDTIDRPIWGHSASHPMWTLPYPLVRAVICQYDRDGDEARLITARELDDLGRLRDGLNETHYPTHASSPPECTPLQEADGWFEATAMARPHVILVVDATGGTAEFWTYPRLMLNTWIWCWEVVAPRDDRSGVGQLFLSPSTELNDYLESP